MRNKRSFFISLSASGILFGVVSPPAIASTSYQVMDLTGKIVQQSNSPIALPGATVDSTGQSIESKASNEFNAPSGFKKSYDKGDFVVVAATNPSDERIGVCDKQGNVIIPPAVAAEIESLGDDIFRRTSFDADGNMIVELVEKGGKVLAVLPNDLHRDDSKFSEGLLKVEGNGNAIGYINKRGEFIVKPVELQAGDGFSEGLANVTYQDSSCGYIDRTGKLVIGPFKQGAVYPFKHGVGIVWDGLGYFGAVDKHGRFLLPMEYESLNQCDNGTLVGKHGMHFEIVSNRGKVLAKLPPTISQVYTSDGTLFPFAEGGAAKPNQPAHLANEKAKWGYLDSTGKVVIEPRYDLAYQFTGNLAVIANLVKGDQVSANSQQTYGVIDKTGKEILQPIYESATISGDKIFATLRQTDSKQPDFSPIDWSREGSARKWSSFLRAHDLIGMTKEQVSKSLGKTYDLEVPKDSGVSGSRVGLSISVGATCGNASSHIEIDFNKEGEVFRWRLVSGMHHPSNWIEENVVLLDDFRGVIPGNLVPKSEAKTPGA